MFNLRQLNNFIEYFMFKTEIVWKAIEEHEISLFEREIQLTASKLLCYPAEQTSP